MELRHFPKLKAAASMVPVGREEDTEHFWDRGVRSQDTALPLASFKILGLVPTRSGLQVSPSVRRDNRIHVAKAP